jgi:hypothetical protein
MCSSVMPGCVRDDIVGVFRDRSMYLNFSYFAIERRYTRTPLYFNRLLEFDYSMFFGLLTFYDTVPVHSSHYPLPWTQGIILTYADGCMMSYGMFC